MKQIIYTFGIFGMSCLLFSSCSVEVNEEGKKKEEKENSALLPSPAEETTLIASNDFAFARKGCKYRW